MIELDALLFFIVILGEGFQINLWNLLILAVELVEFEDGVRLALRVGGIVAEFVSLSVLLDA